jgi:hypothetical protein
VNFLSRRSNTERAQDLQWIADAKWQRQSTNQFDRLKVYFFAQQFTVERTGHPSLTRSFDSYRAAETYVRKFFASLVDGSGAPDDLFIDALESATKRIQ